MTSLLQVEESHHAQHSQNTLELHTAVAGLFVRVLINIRDDISEQDMVQDKFDNRVSIVRRKLTWYDAQKHLCQTPVPTSIGFSHESFKRVDSDNMGGPCVR